MTIPFDKVADEWMKDPEFVKDYEALEPEFTLARRVIKTRLDAGLDRTMEERRRFMNIMRHGDYIARIEYDPETKAFHGRVINLRAVVTFCSSSIEELKTEFARSIETYLEICREEGIQPEKPVLNPDDEWWSRQADAALQDGFLDEAESESFLGELLRPD